MGSDVWDTTWSFVLLHWVVKNFEVCGDGMKCVHNGDHLLFRTWCVCVCVNHTTKTSTSYWFHGYNPFAPDSHVYGNHGACKHRHRRSCRRRIQKKKHLREWLDGVHSPLRTRDFRTWIKWRLDAASRFANPRPGDLSACLWAVAFGRSWFVEKKLASMASITKPSDCPERLLRTAERGTPGKEGGGGECNCVDKATHGVMQKIKVAHKKYSHLIHFVSYSCWILHRLSLKCGASMNELLCFSLYLSLLLLLILQPIFVHSSLISLLSWCRIFTIHSLKTEAMKLEKLKNCNVTLR